jgi:acyl-CoA reductase-like NAD-dependent aldehyde dehydrogenase
MTQTTTLPSDTRHQLMLIRGEWTSAIDGDVIAIESPRDKTTFADIPRGAAKDVDAAVRAAQDAFPAWRDTPGRQRARAIAIAADAIEARTEELSRLLAHETGNAIRTQARPEIKMTVDVMRYFAGLGGELKGITAPLRQGVLDYSRREPLGVVGGIIPWNSPALLAVLKLAPALIAGNTFVLKPAEDAPLTVLEIVRELAELLPSGVLNAVTGLGEEAGAALAAHPGVAKVSFTGSTEVGKSIMHAVSGRIGSVSLELGGKNPQIVFPDADDDWVLDGVILAMRFTRQGQSCTAGSRLFLHESIFDSFLDRLVDRLRLMKVGDPLDEASDMGAIINAKQFNRVCSYIDDGATTPGSKTVLGGLPPSSGPLSEGYFVEPTVIANVENNWRIAQEEIFGPVLCAIPWSETEQAITMANDSHYGLSAFVWTHDLGNAVRTAHAIDSGWVQVNQGGGQIPGQSYGGFKESGLGKEFSLEGMLEDYTRIKQIAINIEH